jgi:5-methylcytosine-specific restriction endonuclease McrA
MANRDRAREAERRYRERHPEKVRAIQAEAHRRARAKDPDKTRANQRAHYAKNRDKIRAQAKARYDACPERDQAYSQSYRARNREKSNALVREWRKQNPEKAKALRDAWFEANPDAHHAMRKRRKALERGASVIDFTAEQWIALQHAFKHRCAYCDKPCKGRLTQDHVVPLSKGGGHTASNIVPACKNCNSRKHTGPPLRPVQVPLI